MQPILLQCLPAHYQRTKCVGHVQGFSGTLQKEVSKKQSVQLKSLFILSERRDIIKVHLVVQI